MLDKIDASPNQAGIDEARKIFDARKADLKAKWDASPRGTNLSNDDFLELAKSESLNIKLWIAADKKCTEKAIGTGQSGAVEKKLTALKDDFDPTFK